VTDIADRTPETAPTPETMQPDESTATVNEAGVDGAVAETSASENGAEPKAARKPRSPRKRNNRRATPPDETLLPVLVVDETLLLPHMSIPFPVENEEAAMVIERASRMNPRHVLVLTERQVRPTEDMPGNGSQ